MSLLFRLAPLVLRHIPAVAGPALAAALLVHPTAARGASGSWNGTQDANWTNSANWSASPYPSGGDTATFAGAGNSRTALDLAGLGGIANITFTGPAAAYSLGTAGQKVTLQPGGTIRLAADAANSQTVQEDLELPAGTSSFTFRNENPDRTLTLGKVHGYTAGGVTKSVYFDGAGPIALQRNLDCMASTVNVYHRTTNTVSFGGAATNLTVLYLDGASAVLNLGSGTAMTFANAGGDNLIASQDATINGPGTITLSTNTGDDHANNAAATGKTLTINAKLTGNTGFQFWHASYYGTIVLTGANDYTRSTVVNVPGTLQFATIGNKGAAGNLGAGTNIVLDHAACRFRYVGAGETTDRTLDVKAGGIFEHAGSGTLVFTAPTASSTSGSKTLTLRSFAAAAGELSGAVQNGSGTVSLTKDGDGTWTLSAANTFSGTLTVAGGTLALSGSQGSAASCSAYVVTNGATLLLNNTAAANNTNRLSDAGPITLLGGALIFTNDNGSADFCENAGALTAGDGASTVAAAQAPEGQTASLRFASLVRANGGTLNFSGAGLGASDRSRIFITGQPQGPLGSWVTVNGVQPAFYDTARGVCLTSAWAVTSIAARGPDSVIPDDASAEVRITVPGESGPITLAGDPTTGIAALWQCANTGAVVATASKTLRAYTVGITNNQAALTLGENVGDGTVTPLTAGGKLDFDNRSGSALTVNATLEDNGAASSIAKNGDGDLVINGETRYTGATEINGGRLTFGGHSVTQRIEGVISGSGALAKSGTNLLQLAGANTFTGPATLSAGIVRVSQGTAFGTTAAGTAIADGATLDVGGAAAADSLNMQQEAVTVQGTGADGRGAIVNGSANQQIYAFGKVELTGDTTFGGSARWDIRDGAFKMNGHAVTKVGASTVSLSATTAVTPGGDAAAFDVQEGTLRLQQSTQLNGTSANIVHLRSGTTLDFYDVVASPAWSLVCEDNTRHNIDNSFASTNNRWSGPVTLNGTLYLASDGNFDGGFSGAISGPGSLFKTNEASLQPHFYITGTNNTFSGPTRVVGGWIHVNNLRNVGQPSSLGQPMTVADGTIRLGGGGTPGRITYQGAGDVTDRVIDMSGTTGWTTLSHEGTGPLVISNLTVSTPGAKILYLLGSSTSTAEIVSAVVNSSSGNITLEKQNAGTWILSGNSTYSGNTTVQDGTLMFKGNNTLAGATTLNKGSLRYYGSNSLNGSLDARFGSVTIYGSNVYGSSAAITVGSTNCVLRVAPGATLACANVFRIGQASSFGAFYLDGGSFTNAQVASEQSFNFGCEASSYGYFLMTGGNVSAGRLQTGGYSGGTGFGTAVLRIKDGMLNFPEWIILGRRSGGKTALTLDGGTFTHTSGNEFALCRNGGDGDVNLTGGTLNNPDGAITFHNLDNGNGTGVVNLCAGRLTTMYFYNNSSYLTNGGAYLMFGGGTLAASANQTAFVPANMSGVYAFGAFGSFAGGAVIDSNGKNITVPAALRAPTGQGVASISLTSQGSGYIGEPYVVIEGNGVGATAVANLADDGKGKGTFKIAGITVTCPGVDYTVTPTVTLRGGGTNLTAAVVGAVTLAPNAGGGLTKTGAGTLTLTGTNTYAGATTVSNGTLRFATAASLPAGTALTVAGGSLDLGGFARTNGAVTASAGSILNGALVADSFTKTGDGTLTLATALQADSPLIIQGGTLRLVTASPGLYEGPLAGAFNTTESMSTNILVQLTTRAANVTTYPPWGTNMTYVYTGYLWNRATTNVTWTFGENVDDSSLLKIDGTTLLNNGIWNEPTIANYTLTPGAHAFEARFGNGGGGAGRFTSTWWTTTAFGFGVDYLGRNATNIANFVALTDPGDGSLLTVASSGTSNQLAAASSVEIASGAALDLAGTVQTLADLSGSGTVSNGSLTVTGVLRPGGEGTLGTLTLPGVMPAGGTLRIDVAAAGASDLLAVTGNIDLSGLALQIANPEALDRTQAYTILTCAGTRTGRFASTSLPDSRWHVVYRADGSVQLLFAAGTLVRVL